MSIFCTKFQFLTIYSHFCAKLRPQVNFWDYFPPSDLRSAALHSSPWAEKNPAFGPHFSLPPSKWLSNVTIMYSAGYLFSPGQCSVFARGQLLISLFLPLCFSFIVQNKNFFAELPEPYCLVMSGRNNIFCIRTNGKATNLKTGRIKKGWKLITCHTKICQNAVFSLNISKLVTCP